MIDIYCDGGCRGNHLEENLGGYGVYIKRGGLEEEYYGSEENTTNNRMEILACIMGIHHAINSDRYRGERLRIFSDSMYVVRGLNEWHPNWIERGWINSAGRPIENQDLWKELIDIYNLVGDVEVLHVRGHSDNEGNNRADALANLAMDRARVKNTAYNGTGY